MSGFNGTLVKLRKVIVNALRAANIPYVGNSVYRSRTMDGFPDEGCFISIYTPSSKLDDGDRNPPVYSVTTSIYVDVFVQGEDFDEDGEVVTIDDKMDVITDKVLEVILHNSNPDSLYKDIELKKMRVVNVSNTLNGNGEADKGIQRIEFSMLWYVLLPVGGALDEFITAGTEMDANGSTEGMRFTTRVRHQ